MASFSKIILRQHFYTGTLRGLDGVCGFQTVARSAGLEKVDEVVSRFTYHSAQVDAPGGAPVNWGWFPCGGADAPEVCLHRIGSAGLDYAGRPGNFFAHSLFVRHSDLRKIDYDIPSLLGWVRGRDGGAGGFVTDEATLHARFGTGPVRLAAVPPLEAPVKEVRRLRDSVDRRLADELRAARPGTGGAGGAGLLGPLRDALGPGGFDDLMAAYLCEGDQERPLLVLGPGDAAGHTALGLAVVELLFALMPYHCRRRLSFATYVAPRDAVAGNDPISPERRRALMTPDGEAVLLPRDPARSPVWVLDASGAARPRHLLPERRARSRAALFCARRLASGDLAALRHVRNFAHAIDFLDEARGLAHARRLSELQRGGTVDRADYPIFAGAARRARPDRPQKDLLELGRKLNGAACAQPEPFVHAAFAAAYMELLARELSRAAADDPAAREGLLEEAEVLFAQVIKASEWGAYGAILQTVFSPDRLTRPRGEILRRFRDVIGDTIRPERAADAPLLWRLLDRAAREAAPAGALPPEVEPFVAQVTFHLCEALLGCHYPGVRARLASRFEEEVLDFLADVPFTSKEEYDRLAACVYYAIAPSHDVATGWVQELWQALRYRDRTHYSQARDLLTTPLGDEPRAGR